MTQLLPNRSLFTASPPRTLAEAVTRVRHPRNRATAQLAPHRDELLRLRAAGESIETLAIALAELGVRVGKETLRCWMARETGAAPRRRRKRAQPGGAASADRSETHSSESENVNTAAP